MTFAATEAVARHSLAHNKKPSLQMCLLRRLINDQIKAVQYSVRTAMREGTSLARALGLPAASPGAGSRAGAPAG
jgi:hypothetical protein